MGNFNFEEYRQPWETGPHWELKREFLERYQDHFQVDRLLCLAQAYSNIELLHCSYPIEVMQQVRELSEPLQGCKRFRGTVEQKNETSKGIHTNSEGENRTKKSSNFSQTALKGKRMSDYQETPKKCKFIKFCSSVDVPVMGIEKPDNISTTTSGANVDYTCITQSSDLKNIQTLAYEVRRQVKKAKSLNVILKSVQSLNMQDLFHFNFRHALNKKCYCELYIGATLLSIGEGNDQKEAKEKAASCALQILSNFDATKNFEQKEFYKINTTNIETPLENDKYNQEENVSQKHFPEASQEACSSFSKQLEPDLMFLENFAKELKNSKCKKSRYSAINLINNTANRLKISQFLVFNIAVDLSSPVHNRTFICDFSVKNIPVSQSKAKSKKRARNQAAEIGLNYLYKLLEQSKNNCSYSESDEVKSSFIEETIKKSKSQIDNLNINCVEETTCVKSTSNSAISTIKSDINNSIKTNFTPFNIVTEANDCKQFENTIPITNDSEKLPAKPFTINKKLLDNSYRQQFVLFDTALIRSVCQQSPGAILSFSVQQCRKQFTFKLEGIQPAGTFKADLILDNNIIATGIGSNKAVAKQEAAQSALEKLRKEVYTIKLLIKTDDEEGFIITRQSILESTNSISDAVSEDNIGCKMLKMMGWTGGGIGKTEGITEPITASDHAFGRGLGYSDKSEKIKSRKFTHKIHTILLEYSQSKETRPLIFSSDFAKSERKEIHTIARKYDNLVSNSYGKDEARQLFIKHKLSITELLNSLLQAGGATNKYELVDLST